MLNSHNRGFDGKDITEFSYQVWDGEILLVLFAAHACDKCDIES